MSDAHRSRKARQLELAFALLLLLAALIACKKEPPGSTLRRYPAQEQAEQGSVTLVSAVTARLAAAPDASPVGQIAAGTSVQRVARVSGFILASWAEGTEVRQGWVDGTELSKSSSSAAAAASDAGAVAASDAGAAAPAPKTAPAKTANVVKLPPPPVGRSCGSHFECPGNQYCLVRDGRLQCVTQSSSMACKISATCKPGWTCQGPSAGKLRFCMPPRR